MNLLREKRFVLLRMGSMMRRAGAAAGRIVFEKAGVALMIHGGLDGAARAGSARSNGWRTRGSVWRRHHLFSPAIPKFARLPDFYVARKATS